MGGRIKTGKRKDKVAFRRINRKGGEQLKENTMGNTNSIA